MSKAQKQSVAVQPSSTAAATTLPGVSAPGTKPAPPDPEVSSDRPKRRTFDAAYKKRILEQHDAAREHPGEIGALLRREGLYSSLVSEWKRQRDDGAAAALAPRKRGRKTAAVDAMAERLAELEREKARLEEHLRKAEIIIDVQKKVSQLLGMPPGTAERGGNV